MNSSNEQLASLLYIESPSRSEFLKKTRLFRLKDIALLLEFPQKTIEKEKVINLINYIHFINEKVLVHLQDPLDGTDYLAEALPDPAFSDEVTCRWLSYRSGVNIQAYQFKHLILPKNNSIVAVPATLKKMTEDFIALKLPDESVFLNRRGLPRFECRDLEVEIRQDALSLRGELCDFNAIAFRIKIAAESYALLSDLNFEKEIQVTIRHKDVDYFSGKCHIVRTHLHERDWDFIFRPSDQNISAPQGKTKIRNPRVRISPQPTAVFRHPFSQKRIEREIVDISNTGFCLAEREDESLLIPGMVIPELTIQNAGFPGILCHAQIIYKRQDEGRFLCGVSILDMDIESYTKLTHLIDHTNDAHAFISKGVDMDALWEFFFDTGFIYPKKYHLIGSVRDDFKRTYQRLYEDCPDIARHFTYEKHGKIFGHISMVKAYSRTWLSHHLAARLMEGRLVGLKTLKQVIHFLNGISRLPSMKTDYVLAFYQPQNGYADRVYGDFQRELNNLQACSLDLFAYITCSAGRSKELPVGYALKESGEDDLREFETFYQNASGGLLLDAMGLKQRSMINEELSDLYRHFGFRRSCRVYSLKAGDETAAVLIVEQSDPGLNLSEILNGIKVFVLKPELVKWDVLANSLSRFSGFFKAPEIAVFIYPSEYLEMNQIRYEKLYQLWVIWSKRYDSDFTEYVVKNFRIKYK